MKREGFDIARCTVERLMRQLDIQGVRRGKKIKTTHGQPADPVTSQAIWLSGCDLNASGRFPSGNVRYYYRPKGHKGIPMPDLPPDDQRFLDAYGAASGGKTPTGLRPRPGSLALAVLRYLASDSFAALSNETRSSRRRMLDEIRRNHGKGLVRELRTKHVESTLKKFSGHARNNRLKVWRAFGKWLNDVYKIDDPAENVKKSPVPKSKGHLPWTDDQIETFRGFWIIGTPERLAFEVIYFTGARISDAFRLGQGNVDHEGWLVFNQQKTGGEVAIPFSRPLPDFVSGMQGDLQYLRAALDARSDNHITWITTAFGTSRSVKAAGQWFAAKARAAGIHGRTAHGLRKSRSRALAEAGGNSVQIGAWTDHESLSEIERYIRGLNKKRCSAARKQNKKFQLPQPKFQINQKRQENQMLEKVLATPAGFEPATCPLGGGCSIQLSHGVILFDL